MAYYDSGFYEISDYHSSPYASSDDIVPYQNSVSCSDFEFNDPQLIQHYPTSYHTHPHYESYYPSANYTDAYDYYAPRSDINYYFTYNYNEPKLIAYEPVPYETGHVSYQTQYLIAYSTTNFSEFNEPEFEEYDPTPYGGGYDLTLTYGKPLPPSNEICYPRSRHGPNGSIPHDENLSNGSVPLALGGNGSSKIPNLALVEHGHPHEIPNLNPENEESLSVQKGGDLVEQSDSSEGEEEEGYTYPHYEYGYPWSGYEYGIRDVSDEKQVNPWPYEDNPEVVDLCESFFGRWPCLARKNKRINPNQEIRDEAIKNKDNLWEGTADYLFGYEKQKDSGNACESYYQQQPCTVEEQYYEDPWIQKLNIF